MGNLQRIRIRTHVSNGFLSRSGVRQGCRLSPLLFVVAIDVLLRRISRIVVGATLRAFADDIGLILPRFVDINSVFGIFSQFARMSGLRLNLPKTWLVPLWNTRVATLKRMLRDDYPHLASVGVAFVAKYLGALLGPQAVNSFWQEAIGKYLKACSRWSRGPWGLTLAADVYNIYCLSTLGFLAQFCCRDAGTLKAERKGVMMFARGPGNWITSKELFHLQSWFGFSKAYKSILHPSLAARLRVARYEQF